MSKLTVILGNQLFDFSHYKNLPAKVFMCEDWELCTHYKYHKHKIIHFLASMREYADLLKEKGKSVYYFKLENRPHFMSKLEQVVEQEKVTEVTMYEIEDKFFESRLIQFFKNKNVGLCILESPLFLCSRNNFKKYLKNVKKPFMNSFYMQERRRLNLLMEGQSPVGGQWSYDNQNRKKIPKNFTVTGFEPSVLSSKYIKEVGPLVSNSFNDHPGDVDDYWIPTNKQDSLLWLRHYLKDRFEYFGDYQDALDDRNDFLYHSVISPMMNIGFLTPDIVLTEVLKFSNKVPLNSLEGMIRQVIGWREFVRGIYQNFDELEQKRNFFEHKKKLSEHWYIGNTDIPPLDFAIQKSLKWGYCHHIERLMVIGNLMLLLEIHPQQVYAWFMEMFVDSSDWVMGPNVFGMSQFSDGGLFATKPYICGSNYLLKMGHFKKGDWCDGVDGLYWSFINKHREFFKRNHRMSMMVRSFDKLATSRKEIIFKQADLLRAKLTL